MRRLCTKRAGSDPGRSAGRPGERGLRVERSALTDRQTSAEGIVGSTPARLVRHPKAKRRGNRSAEPQRGPKARTGPREGHKCQEGSCRVARGQGLREAAGAAPGRTWGCSRHGDTRRGRSGGRDRPAGAGAGSGQPPARAPTGQTPPGAPGVDGRTVEDLGEYLRTPGPTIRAALLV